MPKRPCEILTIPLQSTKLVIALLLAAIHIPLAAAELNTRLPTASATHLNSQITVNLPSQTLDVSLRQFSKQAEIDIAYDTALVRKIQAPEVKGSMSRRDVLQKLLSGSGLSISYEDNAATIIKTPEKDNTVLQLDSVNVRAKRFYEIGPLPGLGLTKEQIPGNVQSISAKEIKEAHSLSLTDLMNRKLQSVTVNDYQGNPFMMDVQYRGFTAGPQIGTPQGLSVFLDGIRVNEPFGDVVNWDMIPMNALAGVDVFPGSNPIFGLNTLGGAFAMKTKDGFNNAGADVDILTGAFGRKQLQVEGGWNNGTVALFGAGNFFLEDGWRENSPSKVNQLFTKASYRGDKLDLNLSTLLVQTNLVGNGLLPSQMYEQDRNSVFTSPDKTKNELSQFQLSGSYFVDDSFTITGQIYRRNSKRTQKGSDVFTDYKPGLLSRRRVRPGEEYTCLFASTNGKGIPDYYVIPVNEAAGEDLSTVNPLGAASPNGGFANDYAANGFVTSDYDAFKNTPLDADYAAALKAMHDFHRNQKESIIYKQDGEDPVTGGPPIITPGGSLAPSFTTGADIFAVAAVNPIFGNTDNILYGDGTYFYKTVGSDLIRHVVIFTAPTNLDACLPTKADNQANGVPFEPYSQKDAAGNPIYVDGASGGGIDPLTGRSFPGVVVGTPTAIINNNQIDQVVDGGSLQFNWNLEKHKFMVGMSMDIARADYSNTSQLGFLDADRNAYLDPAQAAPQFIGAMQPISNNNFEGTQTTQSIYFSETWSPIETLHISTSARYNQTFTKNKIAARYGIGGIGIGDLDGVPDEYNTCDGDCSTNRPPVNYRDSRFLSNMLQPAETEKFSFYSFNPSLGASWQATQNLNAFVNWAQGIRVPSVVELGCAFDDTPTPNSEGAILPRSIAENRQCTLPTTLSGDPFLPQIKATTHDIGLRGTFDDTVYFDRLNWNVGAYQTDLKDDIYFVAVGNGAGFFQTIGKTRRRGIEAGFSGQKDRWSFGANYSLTDATFEDNFLMLSMDNSSSVANTFGNVIEVSKGSRMPGVALQNLNANVSFDVTPEWRVGLTTVMHSESFLRGNENNEHKVGVIQDRGQGAAGNALRRPTNNPGKVDGYATFNFQTSYKFNKEWTATMLVNNIFDKEYFTAGRLGRNPFSPSLGGAIGPDGYNHNSNDWLSTNFIAPGAPRGVWFSLNWHFVPD